MACRRRMQCALTAAASVGLAFDLVKYRCVRSAWPDLLWAALCTASRPGTRSLQKRDRRLLAACRASSAPLCALRRPLRYAGIEVVTESVACCRALQHHGHGQCPNVDHDASAKQWLRTRQIASSVDSGPSLPARPRKLVWCAAQQGALACAPPRSVGLGARAAGACACLFRTPMLCPSQCPCCVPVNALVAGNEQRSRTALIGSMPQCRRASVDSEHA